MSERQTPSWDDKTDAIRDAVAWASGVCGDWKFKSDAYAAPRDNEAWFELRMGRILELGVDERVNEDNIDPVTGEPDLENPRREVYCGQRQFFVELRFFNTDQEQDHVAWVVAERCRTRMRMTPVVERWLDPADLAIVEQLQVIPMPQPVTVQDMRCDSEAVLEVDFLTSTRETDPAAVGTWVQRVEGSGVVRCSLDETPFPWSVGDEVFPPGTLVDDDGKAIVDDSGKFVIYDG